ncbi:type VI secretion system lipoprotein TssJ [Vibrio sp. WXL103]|uniref:type VI secretion system lipoprotein TssJ n=1 Tax=Vibrio sp. WXL103 TaxID=3450710 RepID=UPI003EC629C5
MRKSFIALLCVLLSGCSVWVQFKDSVGLLPSTSQIELNIAANQQLNQRSDGSSSPVLLRVYELSSPVLFRSLGFYSLFEDDQASLGDEYVRRYEFQLEPGDTWNDHITLDEQTRALGFAVAFRDSNGAVWRFTYDIDERRSYYLDVDIENNVLSVDKTSGVEQIYF